MHSYNGRIIIHNYPYCLLHTVLPVLFLVAALGSLGIGENTLVFATFNNTTNATNLET